MSDNQFLNDYFAEYEKLAFSEVGGHEFLLLS